MGEAKRRKQFDKNYGKKLYSIKFLDYESWKAQFTPEEFQEYLDDELGEEDIKEFFEDGMLWGGNIKIKNSSYPFMILTEEDDEEVLHLDLRVKSANNKEHQRIIERNIEKIQKEFSDVIIPEYERLNDEKWEKLKQETIKKFLEVLPEYIDEYEDEFDEYDDEFEEDEFDEDEFEDEFDEDEFEDEFDEDEFDEDEFDNQEEEDYNISDFNDKIVGL